MNGHRPRHRRTYAITAALLWLLGVEVLPNLHLATHRDDHTHVAGGTLVVVTFDEHRHAGGHGADHDDDHHHPHEHHDDPDHARAGAAATAAPAVHRDRARRAKLAIESPASGHQAAGIAHHAIALHQPPPPALAPYVVPLVSAWRHAAPPDRIDITRTARPAARGPPVG
ncbi:MAG: hypothetical protein M3680_18240 [Myxococcota bacterium]|nr:hypothetical protein [Myxococcota bacterium]